MTEYKGNLKVGDYIKIITDKSKYFEDECKILYFTSQNRIAVRVVNPSKIDKHKGKKLLISIKSVTLYRRVCDAYTKILPQKELYKHIDEVVHISVNSRSKYADRYGKFKAYTTRDRLVVVVNDEYTTIARTNVFFKNTETKPNNILQKDSSVHSSKYNYLVAKVQYETNALAMESTYKLFDTDIKIGDYVLTSDFCTTCAKYYKSNYFPKVIEISPADEINTVNFNGKEIDEIICRVDLTNFRARNTKCIEEDIQKTQNTIKYILNKPNLSLDNVDKISDLYDILACLNPNDDVNKELKFQLRKLKELIVLKDNVTK